MLVVEDRTQKQNLLVADIRSRIRDTPRSSSGGTEEVVKIIGNRLRKWFSYPAVGEAQKEVKKGHRYRYIV